MQIVDIYIKFNIFIPLGTRCCRTHFDQSKYVSEIEIKNITIIKPQVKLFGDHVKTFFQLIRQREKSSLFNKFSNYPTIRERLCFSHTGFTKDEFYLILNELKSLKNSPQRSREQALAIYLFWLKTGIAQNTINAIFGLDMRQKISDYCGQVRGSLIKEFVPQYLGSCHRTRENFLVKNISIVKTLYDMEEDQLCLIAYGTYIYCQKSSNNKLQRKLWSGHKKRPLIKPFVICCSNGYIVDVYGPFAATENDARILLHLLDSNKELKALIKPNDLLILDRGFRDACGELKNTYHLIPKMPACKTICAFNCHKTHKFS